MENIYNPRRIRRFVSKLSGASTKYEDKIRKTSDVKGQIEKLKSLSLNKRTKKVELEEAFQDFEDSVREVIMDDHKILEEQRRETKEVIALKGMIEDLSKKLVQLGKEYAIEMEKKDKKIFELRDSLASSRMSGPSRKEKIAALENKVKSDGKSSQVESIKSRLKSLEDTHRQLVKSGVHSKKDLDRLKKTIDAHKKKISQIRSA